MKYKVIEEYSQFYLAIHPKGYKECFPKYKYKPDENGYITKKQAIILVDKQCQKIR